MARRDDDEFRAKPGAPRARGEKRPQRFVSQVLKAASRAGPLGAGSRISPHLRPGAARGRGQVAARLNSRTVDPRARRVIVKVRHVKLGTTTPAAVQQHLRYITRDGVTQDGAPGKAYGPSADEVDTRAFAARGAGDRHQFRLIVAGEDGTELGELKEFTRQLMGRVEQDLGTRLEWVAVDHWNTDNPHTHVVLRGKDQAGQDLVIARDYIAHGLRGRACELATEWLGPRTEREIRQANVLEVEQERWTTLDRTIERMAVAGVVDLRAVPGDVDGRFQRSLLVGRLQRLNELGLAEVAGPSVWTLSPGMKPALQEMAERGDIIRTLQRAMGAEQRQPVIFDPATSAAPVLGRIAAKGLAGEQHDRGYLIVDGIDGRAHHVALTVPAHLTDLPAGGIVEVRGVSGPRAADRAIATVAIDGCYRTQFHLARVHAEALPGRDPEAFVAAHTRRLEALRRAGIVERLEEGVWQVPADLLERGQAYDLQRLGGAIVELRSHLPIERQTRTLGATWLDRELLSGASGIATVGFGASVREALTARTDFLVEQNLAERRGTRLVLARDLLSTLRQREIALVGERIAGETGLSHRPLVERQRIAGTYRRSVWLASGRFAMLDDGQGFSLVPWRPLLERRLGQSMSAFVDGDRVTWELGRTRVLSR